MSAEIDGYRDQLGWILDQVAVSLGGLPASRLAWRPEGLDANSIWAITSHIVGCTRAYVLGLGCGLPIYRDRAAEFSAVGDDADELIREVRRLALEIDSALAGLAPAKLDETLLAPQELWGLGEPHEISRRQALIQSIRHSGIHLGELMLTREFALKNA